MSTKTETKPVIGGTLPLDLAVILLGTKWETPLDQLRPRKN